MAPSSTPRCLHERLMHGLVPDVSSWQSPAPFLTPAACSFFIPERLAPTQNATNTTLNYPDVFIKARQVCSGRLGACQAAEWPRNHSTAAARLGFHKRIKEAPCNINASVPS